MPSRELAEQLIGGIATSEVPTDVYARLQGHIDPIRFILPPVPNTLFQRDPSCWIYGGVTSESDVLARAQAGNAAPARGLQVPSALQGRATSRSGGATATRSFGAASLEGGDVMPIGKGVVLIGMGERTTRQAVFQVAAALFEQQGRDARDRLPDAQEPRRHAPGHRLHASATATW